MDADGLNALVRTVGRYSVVPCPAGPYLVALLKFIEKIIKRHGSDERMRNLIETPLFAVHIKYIFENATVIGPEVVSSAASVTTTFIRSEPDALAILQECGVEEAFVKCFNQLASSNLNGFSGPDD